MSFSMSCDCVTYDYNMCDITFYLLSKFKIIKMKMKTKIKIKIKIKEKENKIKSSLMFITLTIISGTVPKGVLELEWQY